MYYCLDASKWLLLPVQNLACVVQQGARSSGHVWHCLTHHDKHQIRVVKSLILYAIGTVGSIYTMYYSTLYIVFLKISQQGQHLVLTIHIQILAHIQNPFWVVLFWDANKHFPAPFHILYLCQVYSKFV